MRAIFVVVGNVFTEQAFQVPFIERDDVIQQFSAAGTESELGRKSDVVAVMSPQACPSSHALKRSDVIIH